MQILLLGNIDGDLTRVPIFDTADISKILILANLENELRNTIGRDILVFAGASCELTFL